MKKNSEEEDLSDNESDSSDCDYVLNDEDLKYLTNFGIDENRAQDLWIKQCGMCYISNIPLTFTNGPYMTEVAHRRSNECLSDTNSVLVCKIVHDMKNASGLTWTQFKTFLNMIVSNFE